MDRILLLENFRYSETWFGIRVIQNLWAISRPRQTCCRLSSGQCEVHHNRCVDLDWLAVEEVRLVLPLFHGFNCRGSQHRMTADQCQVLDGAVLADHRLQDYLALDARLPGNRGIIRLHLVNQETLRDALRYAD